MNGCESCKYGPTWETCNRPEKAPSICYFGSHWKPKEEPK